MVSVQSLIYYMKVYEKRSLSKAAEELFVTQPALSLAMKNLEEQLHVTLFLRNNRGVEITKDGELLYHHCELLLLQLGQIENLGQRQAGNRLSFCAFPDFCPPETLERLMQQPEYAGICIDFEACRTAQALKNVENGLYEFGIIQYNPRQKKAIQQQLKQMHLAFEPIDTQNWGVAVGPHSPLYEKTSVMLKDLKPFRQIRLPDDFYSNITSEIMESNTRAGNLPYCLISSDELTGHLLKTTDMYMFCSAENRAMARRRGLHIIPIEKAGILITIGWIKQSGRELSRVAAKYLELFTEDTLRYKKEL